MENKSIDNPEKPAERTFIHVPYLETVTLLYRSHSSSYHPTSFEVFKASKLSRSKLI